MAAFRGGRSGRANEPAPPSRGGVDRLTVFVSYSRTDSAFADEIEAGLEYDGGFRVLMDRHDIHEGEAWKARLGALIVQSDTVVFILSRQSAASPICRWEVERAQRWSKRIIPVQVEALGGSEAPPALSALNYVRFDEGRSFMTGLTGLRRALKTDIEWIREHTRLLTRAEEWDEADRAANRLLSGSDIVAAKAWLDRSPAEGLQPTELHRDFIQTSDQAEALRLSAERERAERLARAVKRTRLALVGAVAFACLAGAAALYAQRQEQRASASAEFARTESARADQFVNLVSSHPAGQRAMVKICREAIEVTSILATTGDPHQWQQTQERFWELYYASMYIVELHERKTSGNEASAIEDSMVRYGRELSSLQPAAANLPHASLCPLAKEVRDSCLAHLPLTAREPCP